MSDGKETVSTSATFTKAVHAASVTLAEPLAVEGDITVAVLQVTGSIPDDAKFKAEVTNNALDSSPVWQDATTEVKKGVNIVFENKTCLLYTSSFWWPQTAIKVEMVVHGSWSAVPLPSKGE